MASLLLVRFVDETVSFLPYGAAEMMRQDLDLTYVQAGVLLTLYPGIGLLTTPLGWVVDVANRRLLSALGGVCYGAGFCVFAAAGDFWTLVVAVCVMGIGADLLVGAAEVSLVEAAGDRAEPALARANLLAAVGDLAGPALLAATLATGLGWRAAFWAAGALLFAYGLILAAQPLPSPAPRSPDFRAWRTMLEVARDRRVIVSGLLVAVIVAFDDTFVGFAVAFLITDQSLTPSLSVLAVGAGLTGGVAAAAWASRTNRRRVSLRTCALTLTAGVALLLAIPHVAAAIVGMAAVGAAANLGWIILQARYMTLRPGQVGTTSSIAEAVSQVGVLTPLAIGYLADQESLTVAMLLYLALAAVFVFTTRRDTA